MPYWEGLKCLPVQVNFYDEHSMETSFWLSCMIISRDALCKPMRGEEDALCAASLERAAQRRSWKPCQHHAEDRPIWKPMHMQPMQRMRPFVVRDGDGRTQTRDHLDGESTNVGADIFARGLCLPSDNKITPEEQDQIIEIIRGCFA